jgi:hypothetical protein
MSLNDTRGATVQDGTVETLVFIDVILTQDGDLIAEVSLQRRIDRPETVDLEVKLTSGWTLPKTLSATLSWGTRQKSAPVAEDGIALFTDIPVSSLNALPDHPDAPGLSIVLAPV